MSDVSRQAVRQRYLWIMGVSSGTGREQIIRDYLAAAGYRTCMGSYDELLQAECERPIGIVLDISPHATDGWGLLLKIKGNALTRNIPVLLVFLSETGKVGGVFPVAGYFVTPADPQYVADRLTAFGLTEDVETWDLQALLVTRSGDEGLARTLNTIGYEVVNAYTAKEAMALTSLHPKFLAFCSLHLPDMTAFELLEKFRLFPYSRNMPVFVLCKGEMKDGEKQALSREIAHLVSKKQLTEGEFLAYLPKRTDTNPA